MTLQLQIWTVFKNYVRKIWKEYNFFIVVDQKLEVIFHAPFFLILFVTLSKIKKLVEGEEYRI
jgi:hypothetical protein